MRLPIPESVHRTVGRWHRRLSWLAPRAYVALRTLLNPALRLPADFDLAVAGFARSGNTFVRTMLELTQLPSLRLVTHLHIPPFVLQALETGRPTILLLREPGPAAVSLSLHSRWSLPQSLEHYIAFHECLAPCRGALTTVRYDDFTQNFAGFVEDLNERFDLGLSLDFDPHETQASALERIERRQRGGDDQGRIVHRPTFLAARRQAELHRELETPSCMALLREAQAAFERWAPQGKKKTASSGCSTSAA